VLTLSAVDNSIGGVMVIVLTSSAVDNSIGSVMVITITPPMLLKLFVKMAID
jgi:hypothetical protein